MAGRTIGFCSALQLLAICSLIFSGAFAKLLVHYDASKNDPVSNMGQNNLEAARGQTVKSNTPDLYIKADKDWRGTACAHFHRKKGNIRAEYHALKDQTKAGTTYYIGYSVAFEEIEDSLMVWQWKEYEANTKGGANIPLSLEIKSGKIQFEFQPSGKAGREVQWSTPVVKHKVYNFGIQIEAKASGGHARLWLNGKPVTFTSTKSQEITGNTYPGNSSPKFGAYRGEAVQIDTYVYEVQVGTFKSDVDSKFF